MWLAVIGAIASAAYLYIDYRNAQSMEESVSQFGYLLDHISMGMSFDDFLVNCWAILLCLFCLFWIGLYIAFPKKKGGKQ